MHCTHAIINFIVIARYTFHDMKFLKYFDHALYYIDKLKDVFKDLRSKISHRKTVNENNDDNVNLKKWHFNFFKFHVISHYKELIELYKSVKDFDIEHFKVIHKYLVKCFYQFMNKRENFEIQIMQHNTWLINMLIFEDMIKHQKFRKILTMKDKLQINWSLSWVLISIFWLNLSTWYQSSDLTQILNFNILTWSDINLKSILNLSSQLNLLRNWKWH